MKCHHLFRQSLITSTRASYHHFLLSHPPLHPQSGTYTSTPTHPQRPAPSRHSPSTNHCHFPKHATNPFIFLLCRFFPLLSSPPLPLSPPLHPFLPPLVSSLPSYLHLLYPRLLFMVGLSLPSRSSVTLLPHL